MIDLKWNITCPNCGYDFKVDLSDYVTSEDSEEREMGLETEYTIECDEYECPECKKNISISGSVWEYPEDSINSDSIEVEIED